MATKTMFYTQSKRRDVAPPHRSGDRALAARLALPQTHFQLDYARPEQLLLRVMVRGLVMWDEVLPTDAWVDDQVTASVSPTKREEIPTANWSKPVNPRSLLQKQRVS